MTKTKILQYMEQPTYKPMTGKELTQAMEISKEHHDYFLQMLVELELEGQIVKLRKGRYQLLENTDLILGNLQAHKGGFGFLIPVKEDQPDVYIGKDDLKSALHNDRVLVRLLPSSKGRKLEGEIVQILERANDKVVGTFQKSKNFGFVVPDDPRITSDIFIPQDKVKKAKDNQKVVALITKWPEQGKNMEGEVIEILGDKQAPGVDILSIIRKHDLPEDFPIEVWREVKQFSPQVKEEDLTDRVDLREKTLITIDGEDAKDLDDAISIEKTADGNYLLGVHIADVGHYVREGSALDKEAYKRGTSVYLVDRVIPMLPPELSNGICSLNAGEDRLAMSVFMEYTPQGKLVRHEIQDTVIKVTSRMTYTKVKQILADKDPELLKTYSHLVAELKMMEKLAKALRKQRMTQGSIDFDFPEVKVLLDEHGKPVELKKMQRTVAEQIIEEFMLSANRVVAETIFWLNVPFLYRVHEKPNEEKVFFLKEFLFNLGYRPRGLDKGHPTAFQKVLEKVAGKPEERVINTIMLRAMQRARYSSESLGHFGLAAEYYSHFTSPIRRYPDLVIHRIIREVRTKGVPNEKRRLKLEEMMPQIALKSSLRERVAEEAERETVDLKKVEYMSAKIGEVFPGIVSSIQPFGCFVELENLVEGLIHISNLTDDYYNYYPHNYTLVGEKTGKAYKIGDQVQVKVLGVDLDERKIDLVISNEA